MSKLDAMICIAGGGTGGHVMPALALADAVRVHWANVEVSFIGAERGLEARLLPERGEQVLLLPMHAIQGAGLWQRVRVLLWELPTGVLKILKTWRKRKPQVLVGVGGYASVAGVVAALLSRVPVVLYEQNAIPGLVNRVLFRFCDVMMLGFPSAEKYLPTPQKIVVTGNVIRQAVSNVSYQATVSKPCLLVVGGSQGAMFLNETVPAACAALIKKGRDFSVIHVVGSGDGRVEAVSDVYQQAGVSAEVMAYAEDMPSLFARASLMIARAGAMTVCEAAAVGMPAMFVPLPSAADNHQYFNATALANTGASLVIEQKKCDMPMLTKKLSDLLFNSELLNMMSEKSKQAFVQDASSQQVKVLARFLTEVTT